MKCFLRSIADFSAVLIVALCLVSCAEQTGMTQKVKSNYILVPGAEQGVRASMEIIVDGVNILGEAQSVVIPEGEPDYFIPVDVKAYKGKVAEVRITKMSFGRRDAKSTPADNNVTVEIRQTKAPEYEYDEPYRPVYHFSPDFGWTNDPNGMVYSDGEYHLAYQKNPYGTRHSNMHWGNAVTTDLVHWEDLPFIVAPDSLGAVFSGSSVEDTYNTAGFGEKALIAMYTSAGRLQRQSIAYSTDRGRTYTKFEGNPVITDLERRDFRDPKIMRYEDKWVVAIAAGDVISFYDSYDLKNWTKISEFGKGIGSHAAVWECPDLIPIEYEGETKWVLLVSINPGGPNGGSVTQYFIGDFDGKNYTADPLPYPLWIDEGMDNYAGVTFANTGDRHIFLGWMSNWFYSNDVPTKNFRNAMTIARDLSLKHNGKHLFLASTPSPEILSARQEPSEGDVLPASGAYEMTFTFKPEGGKQTLRLYNSLGEEMVYTFDFDNLSLSLDRSKSGNVDFNPRFSNADIRTTLVKRDEYKVRLFVDRHSTEMFINDGDLCFTNTMFPTESYDSYEISGPEVSDLVVYELK